MGVREERNERIIHPGKSTVSHIISKHKEIFINEVYKLVCLLMFLARFDFKKAEKRECPNVSNIASQQVLNHGVLQMHEDKGMYISNFVSQTNFE
jgi:hypothetical protein